ncbi:MAG: sigma-E processing peptidase SpoIIGA [Clostridia bacterium]|jgi:stage II sporulation protein GA (sporulation sigma-E factor processing peptidase)|nr:sigma-E processing peptidase SpoIIGA [Clostridia bacterium]
MTIYIECVLFDNLVINTLILFLTGNALKIKVKPLRLFFSALLGTAFAFVMPLITLPTILLLMVKFIIGLLMVLTAFYFKRVAYYLIAFLIFLVFTFIMGGMCIGMLLVLDPQFTLSANLNYQSNIPVGLILGLVSGFFWLMYKLINYLLRKKQTDAYVYKIKIINQEKELDCNAFLDTGNQIYDKISGKGISVITMNLFEKLFNREVLIKVLCGQTPINNSYFANFSGISEKHSRMLIFNVEKILIYFDTSVNIIDKPYLAVNLRNFRIFGDCEILLHQSIIERKNVV